MSAPNRTALNMVVISAASLAQTVIQLVWFAVAGSRFGASDDTDMLAAALVVPTVLAAIITGSLAYVLVPELTARLNEDRASREGWGVASYVGLVTTGISLIVTCLLFFFSESLCIWLYDTYSMEKQLQTAELLRILSIQVVLTGLISWSAAVQHSVHRFMMPALAGVMGTGIGLLFVSTVAGNDIALFAWAINIGSFISVVLHVAPIAIRLGTPNADSQSLWRMVGMFWPLLLGTAFLRFDPLIDRMWAADLEGTGFTYYINSAHRIMAALLMVGTSSLAVIAFPQLAQRLASDGRTGFIDQFAVAARRLVLLVTPISIGVSLFGVHIVTDLLQRGEFTAADSKVVGGLIAAMMGMFIGASCGELLARGFYVLGDTRTPTFIGAGSLVVGLIAKFALFHILGVYGIALGVSLYFILSATIMAVLLVRRLDGKIFSGCWRYLGQAIFASLTACACCFAIFATTLGTTWVAGPVGALVYFLVLLMTKNIEAWIFVDAVKARLKIGVVSD